MIVGVDEVDTDDCVAFLALFEIERKRERRG
jgi:hypothetical protein